jgi:DNA transposition AAA+ family ATPase
MVTLTQKQQVSEAVRGWIDEKNPARSGNKLAEKSGVSNAYVSKIKNGEFDYEVNNRLFTISDAAYHRIADALGLRFDGQLHWDFLHNFRLVQRVCRKAQRRCLRYILDGWTGQGKTYSLEHYAVTTDYSLYVKCTQNMTAKGLLDTILERLGQHDLIRSNYDKIERIRRVLLNRKGYLIIIDEAEVVKPGIYAVIKDIADFTNGKCGFVLCGMELIKKLEALAGRHKPGFPQLRRRFFGNQAEVQHLSQAEIIQVCEFEKVTNKGAQNILATTVKDLDMLSQYIADIKEWQQANDKKITGPEVVQLLGLQYLTYQKGA